MPTTGPENRRSQRIFLKVPLVVWGDLGQPIRAHTAVVNQHGALILLPRPFASERLLKVLNQDSGESVLCRVAWDGGEELPGLFKLGIEILGEALHFWGSSYEAALDP